MSNYEFDDIGSIPIGAASYRNNHDIKGEEIPGTGYRMKCLSVKNLRKCRL